MVISLKTLNNNHSIFIFKCIYVGFVSVEAVMGNKNVFLLVAISEDEQKGIKEINLSVTRIHFNIKTKCKKSCNGTLIHYIFIRERANRDLKKIFIHN